MTESTKMPAGPCLSPEKVAEELSIPLSSARAYMLGMKGVFRVGRHLRIRRLDFERWIARQQDEHALDVERSVTPTPIQFSRRWSRPIAPRTKPLP